MPHLESYAYSLQSLLTGEEEYDMPQSLYPTGPTNTLWRCWIFRESARRTMLVCFFFLSLYHRLSGNQSYCGGHPALSCLWTASAHLWHASSVIDFAIAWKDRRHFVIRDLDYTKLLEDARSDDIDTFGKILLVASIGADDARGWFYTRGGNL
jgi:hypothetical protein